MSRCNQCGTLDHEPCPDCGGIIHVGDWPFCKGNPADHVPARASRHFITPVVVFRAKNGKIRIPPANDVRTPRGYERVEISDLQSLQKFSNEYSGKLRSESAALRELHDAHFEAYQKERRSELRQAMQSMPPIMRKVAEMVMKRNDAKSSRRRPEDFEAGFQVLNYDSRSLEAQRDSSTDWKERRV